MQEKEPIMVVWCKLKVPSLRITVRHHSAILAMLNSYRRDRIFNPQLTVRHHSASLAMLNSYGRDRIFNPQLTAIKNSYDKVNV